MPLDVKIFYFFNNFAGKAPILDALFVFFADYFQYILGAIFIGLIVYYYYSKEEKRLIPTLKNISRGQFFWVTAISVLISRGIITEIIRFFYRRPRPFSVYQVHQLTTDNSSSFPSGHATFFFALAMAVYFYNKKWGLGFFAAAVLITVSRVIAGVHYPADILGGAIIGVLTAWTVFYLSKKWEKS